jgi:hypothetical protein
MVMANNARTSWQTVMSGGFWLWVLFGRVLNGSLGICGISPVMVG